MVEIQLSHPFCEVDKGCASLQVLAQRVDGVEEQLQRHDEVHKEIFSRLNAISGIALTILLTLLGTFISIAAGLLYLIIRKG